MIIVKRLIWDAWNKAHIARHNVAPKEVEEVCASEPVVNKTYQERLRVIGQTKDGRVLTVVLGPKPDDVYYPVTARPASRKERRRYQEVKGGEQAA